MSTAIEWSDALQRHVDRSNPGERATPVVDRIRAAISDGRPCDAARLIDYFMELAAVRHASYNGGRWQRIETWLGSHGWGESRIKTKAAEIIDQLEWPDGSPYDPLHDWRRLAARARVLAAELRTARIETADALDELEGLLTAWRELHDRSLDYIVGFLNEIVRDFGEAALGDAMRTILTGTIRGDEPPESILEHVLSGMAGHVSGPGRRGGIEFTEHPDRWELEFDPCGSGGRSFRDSEHASTTLRSARPLGFDALTEPHEWAWNTPGVCHYCTHCCLGMQLMPIEENGRPNVVVTPPAWDADSGRAHPVKCRFEIYKDPASIPANAFTRVGQAPPSGRP